MTVPVSTAAHSVHYPHQFRERLIFTGQNISGMEIDTVMTDEPEGFYTRTYYGSFGWQEGLPLATEKKRPIGRFIY